LGEVQLYIQGYADSLDHQMDMLAWHASITLSPHTKKGKSVTPDKLRGKKPKSGPSTGSEVLAELQENADKKGQEAFWKKGKGREWQQISEE